MIRELTVLITQSTDPWRNLALEEYLLDSVTPGSCTLYLWQNRRTVVLGRNQNADNECALPLLLSDGGKAARRLSGGGAVYHDLGNLNFTFLLPSEDFDTDRQNQVLITALRQFGIQAEQSGRNDLTADGRKFSGQAFYRTGGRSYHHGTLMVDVDRDQMARYLNVSPLKLKAKGVSSVRSRVINLIDLNPSLTVPDLRQALVAAFEDTFGLNAHVMPEAEIDERQLAPYIKKFSSPEWIYRESHPAQYSRQARFFWGTVRLDFSVRDDVLTDPALWSDGLEADFLEQVPALLTDVPAKPDAVRQALEDAGGGSAMAADIASMLI